MAVEEGAEACAGGVVAADGADDPFGDVAEEVFGVDAGGEGGAVEGASDEGEVGAEEVVFESGVVGVVGGGVEVCGEGGVWVFGVVGHGVWAFRWAGARVVWVEVTGVVGRVPHQALDGMYAPAL